MQPRFDVCGSHWFVVPRQAHHSKTLCSQVVYSSTQISHAQFVHNLLIRGNHTRLALQLWVIALKMQQPLQGFQVSKPASPSIIMTRSQSYDQVLLNKTRSSVRRWLILFRLLQVILSLAASVFLAWGLAVLARSWRNNDQNEQLMSEVDRAMTESGVRLSDDEARGVANVITYAALGIAIALLVISLFTFLLTFVWLIYTASDKRRSRATCCGRHGPCTNYTCDIAWDIILLLLWAAQFALALLSVISWTNRNFTTRAIVDIVFTGVMTLLFVLTAFLSGLMKRVVRQTQAQEGFIVGDAHGTASPQTYMRAYMPFGPTSSPP